jgi:hypothetical protein
LKKPHPSGVKNVAQPVDPKEKQEHEKGEYIEVNEKNGVSRV